MRTAFPKSTKCQNFSTTTSFLERGKQQIPKWIPRTKSKEKTCKRDDLHSALWVRVAEIVALLERASLQKVPVVSSERGGGDDWGQALCHIVVGGLDKSHCFLGARRRGEKRRGDKGAIKKRKEKRERTRGGRRSDEVIKLFVSQRCLLLYCWL